MAEKRGKRTQVLKDIYGDTKKVVVVPKNNPFDMAAIKETIKGLDADPRYSRKSGKTTKTYTGGGF